MDTAGHWRRGRPSRWIYFLPSDPSSPCPVSNYITLSSSLENFSLLCSRIASVASAPLRLVDIIIDGAVGMS